MTLIRKKVRGVSVKVVPTDYQLSTSSSTALRIPRQPPKHSPNQHPNNRTRRIMLMMPIPASMQTTHSFKAQHISNPPSSPLPALDSPNLESASNNSKIAFNKLVSSPIFCKFPTFFITESPWRVKTP